MKNIIIYIVLWFLMLLIVPVIFLGGCRNTNISVYEIKSPDAKRVLTFVTVNNFFEPLRPNMTNRIPEGIYMFYGSYRPGEPIPSEYLKLKFSDFPIGIVMDDIIKVCYWPIEVNKIVSRDKIIVYEDFISEEFNSVEKEYRNRTKDLRTSFSLDQIFREQEVK